MRHALFVSLLFAANAFAQRLLPTPYAHLHPIYDELGRMQPDFFEVGVPDSTGFYQWCKGLVDSMGNEVIPPRYQELYLCGDVCLATARSFTTLYFLQTGKSVEIEGEGTMAYFDWNDPFISDIFVEVNETTTLYDRAGNRLIAPGIYTSLSYGLGYYNDAKIRHDVLLARTGAGYGLIRRDGTVIVPMQFEEVNDFYEGFMAVKQGGKWGCINRQGKMVLPAEYEYISNVRNGAMTVVKDERLAMKDTTGKDVIPYDRYSHIASYAFLDPDSVGYRTVQVGAFEGIIDRNCNEIIAPNLYETVISLSANVFMVKAPGNDLYGLVDKQGREILPLEYDYPYRFEDEWKGRTPCIETTRGNRKFHFDYQGKPVSLPPYDNGFTEVSRSTGSYAIGLDPNTYVTRTHRWDIHDDGLAKATQLRDGSTWVGFCDSLGQIIVPLHYRKAGSWRSGCASVMDSLGRYLLVSKGGKEIVPAGRYPWIGDMREGLAPCVNDQEQWGAINPRGEAVIPCQYDEVLACVNGLVPVRKGLKWGLLSPDGKEIAPIQFTEVRLVPGQKTVWLMEGGTWSKLLR